MVEMQRSLASEHQWQPRPQSCTLEAVLSKKAFSLRPVLGQEAKGSPSSTEGALKENWGGRGGWKASVQGSPSEAFLSPSLAGDDCSVNRSSTLGSCPALLPPAVPQQPLPNRGRLFVPPARNPALIVKKKIVDRAILLQKKVNIQNGQSLSGSTTVLPFLVGVQPASQPLQANPAVLTTAVSHSANVKDASTQTALLNIAGPGNQSLAWGGPMLPPAPSSHAVAEKLDAVHTEIQKLSQAMHAVLERQCCLERQQEHQQRLQQEVLMTLQQLSSTVSHGTVPGNQPCVPFSSMAEPSPTVPNFSQFKMELI